MIDTVAPPRRCRVGRVWQFAAGFVVILLSCLPAAAQSTSSTLSGVVRTRQGKPVVAAVVQALSHESGAGRSAVCDAAGRYRFELLQPGTWTVAVRLLDGRLSESRVVSLRLQQASKLDFTVGSGSAEKVTVVAEAPLVDRMETAGKLRVSGQQVAALPLSGRVFTDLALLDSSVSAAAPGNYFGERGSVFTVNGQSGRSNSFLVDGLENNDQSSGTTLNTFYSQEVIQEFVLLTHQYSPEFGRASGGVLNIVTRRGGNEATWNVFAQGSSSSLNASGEFLDSLPASEDPRDAVGRFQTGFSFGGPIKRDQAFYFVAYEHQDITDVRPFTAVDREGQAGGRISAPSRDDNLFVRTDFNLGSRNALMLRLTGDDRSGSSINVGGLNSPEWGFRVDERDINLAASLTTVVSDKLINEVRLLVARSSFDQFANSGRPGVTRPSGSFGGNNLNRQVRDEDRIQLVENLTWRRVNHTLKFGIDVASSRTVVATEFNPNGNFLYETDLPFRVGDCGAINVFEVAEAKDEGRRGGGYPLIPCTIPGADADGDGILNEPGDISTFPLVFQLIDGSPRATLNDTRVGLFAQDRWEVGPRLLLDYGLRYDVSTFTLPATARVDSTIPNGGAGRDWDNVAPRFGFTFTPRAEGNLLVRGGGGIFYDKLVLGFPAVAAITSETEIGLLFTQGFAFELTEDLVEDLGIDAIPLFFPPELTLRFSTGTELDTPYTVQFNLGMEMGLGSRAAFGANVVRAVGHHVPLMRDLNPVVGTTGIGIPVHRDPDRGSIAAIVTEGRSWYSALETNLRWQRDEGWFSASYTWSKAEDLGFDPLKGGIALPPDSDNLAGERGRSDGDRRHRVVLSGDLPLPWMGLRGSGVLQWSTGLPFDVTTGTDDNLDGILSDRPVGVGRNAGADASLDAINSLRRAARLPPIDALDEPSFSQLDLRIYRPFAFREDRTKGEVFLQVFNLLDRVNVGQVEGRTNAMGLGQDVSLAGSPRVVELGLRFGY